MNDQPTILIIIGSIREGRNSLRVANYLERFIVENQLAQVEVADLKALNFPLFFERLQYLTAPPADLIAFSQQVKSADAVLIVTPEYNGGYPAALKNALDALYDEWQHKPVGLATVSSGSFGGAKVSTQVQSVLMSVGAMPIAKSFPVPQAQSNFDESGNPKDQAATDKRAGSFLKELLRAIAANRSLQS